MKMYSSIFRRMARLCIALIIMAPLALSAQTVSGTVIMADDGTPVVGVAVHVVSQETGIVFDPFNTDINGHFIITDVGDPGEYYVWAQGIAFMFTPQHHSVGLDTYYPSVLTRAKASTIHIEESITGIEIALHRGGQVSGTITHELTGEPLDNLVVNLSNAQGQWVVNINSRSAADGSYSVGGIQPGEYFVWAEGYSGIYADAKQLYNDEYYPEASDMSTATLLSINGTQADINFTLSGCYIMGNIKRASNGASVYEPSVRLYDMDWNEIKAFGFPEIDWYYFGQLPPGRYYLGTDGGSLFLPQYYPDAADKTHAQAINLTHTVGLENVDFHLYSGVTVSGCVTTESGTPVNEAEVMALNPERQRVGQPVITNPQGRYEMGGLKEGTFYIVATGYTTQNFNWMTRKKEYLTVYYPNQTDRNLAVPLDITGETTGIDFMLTQGLSISGATTQAHDGQPVAAMKIKAFDTQWHLASEIYTNAQGTYTLGGLLTGDYALYATGTISSDNEETQPFIGTYYQAAYNRQNATVISLTENATGYNFTMSEGLQLSGTVSREDGGTVIYNAAINLYDEYWSFLQEQETNPSGQYTFFGLSPGSYYVGTDGLVRTGDHHERRFNPEYYREAPDKTDATPIILVDQNIDAIDLTLDEGLTISGTVAREDTGAPINGAWIGVCNLDGNFVGDASSDEWGHYTIGGLLPGSYRVFASGRVQDAQCFRPEYYNESPDQAGAAVLELTASLNDINFTLSTGLSLSGTVTRLDNGVPIKDTHIELRGENNDFLGQTRTDPSGQYHFSGLTTQLHYVWASGHCGTPSGDLPLYKEQWFNSVAERANATPLRMASDTTGIDFILEPGCLIMGTVLREDNGQSISNAQVQLYDTTWQMLDEQWSSWANGQYCFGGLDTGDYFIRASGQIFNNDTQEWTPLFHPKFCGDTHDSTAAQCLHVEDVLEGIVFHLRDITVSVESNLDLGLPDTPILFPNYPNPFNSTTTFRFSLPVDSDMKLTVYDCLGQFIATVAQGTNTAGHHIIQWNSKTLPSGIYIAVLKANDFQYSRKLTVLK